MTTAAPPLRPTGRWIFRGGGLPGRGPHWLRAGVYAGLIGVFAISTQAQSTTSRVFGSGANQFTIDFVTIGNANNAADTTGSPNPAGSVGFVYNLGKFEISRDMITKANAAGALGITMQDMSGNGGNGVDKPATGITWYEAAQFVNWLNTSQGYQPAYKFSGTAFALWTSGDVGYQASNPFRNSQARFFLPSQNEWYKGAYGSPSGIWYDYPVGSNVAATAISGGTTAGTGVFSQAAVAGPANVNNAGGLSGYGTMGQGGNVWEWCESAADGSNDAVSENRVMRGGGFTNANLTSSASNDGGYAPANQYFDTGFRVASMDLAAIDTDGDGLSDAVETNTGIYISATNTGTNPNLADTDGDGVSDKDEITAGTNPNAALVRKFGSGTNALAIEFVTIGNPNNAADTTGSPNPAGAVEYTFNLGKHEISRDMIDKANASGGLGLTLGTITGATTNMPATGIDWYEAARFVNWLNTSHGYPAAYKFSGTNLAVWTNGDAGFQAGNPYRNNLARYWLPSVHEWYKGAYGSPSGTWYDYPTGSNGAPTSASSGTNAHTAVYNLTSGVPAAITSAGGLSAFGTMGQGGNAWEWVETAADGTNDDPAENREYRGGVWTTTTVTNLSASIRTNGIPETGQGMGFRVASADLANLDTDGDGLKDLVESNTGTFVSAFDTGTSPTNTDSDGDGLSDGLEISTWGTDPSSSQVPRALVTQQSGANGFVATWGAVTGAAGYEVQASTEPSFTSGLTGGDRPVSGGSITNLAITGVTNQIRYYRVRSVFPLAGGPVKTTWSPAVSAPNMSSFGKYVSLNGSTITTNYFQAGALYSPQGNSYTVSFWLRPDSFGSNNVQLVRQAYNGVLGTANVDLDLLPNGALSFGQMASTVTNDLHVIQSVSPVLLASNWYHVAIVRDATNSSLQLYINGQQAASKTSAYGIKGITTTPALGFAATQDALNDDGNTVRFKGAMDDVRIYTIALSSGQVSLNMASTLTRAAAGSDSTLAFYAPMEGSVVNNTTDTNTVYKGAFNTSTATNSGTITTPTLLPSPYITWAPTNPVATLNAPAVLSTNELTATAKANSTSSTNLAGTWTYSPAAGAGLSVGTNVIVGTFVPTDLDNYSVAMVTNTVVVRDAAAPVISLNGNSSMFLLVGGVFTDPGATVTDNVDATRTIYSLVNVYTGSAYTYTLSYDTTDAAGNLAATVTRTVQVLDPALDQDSDGFSNEDELAAGTNPTLAGSRPASSSRLLVWGETPFATYAVMATGVTQAVLAQVSTATNVIAVLKDGEVTTWSLTGSSLSAYTTPTNATSNVLMIAAGDEHILALKNNGQVVAWGRGFSNNSADPEWGQSLVPSAATSGIVSIAAGGYHSLALREDGRVVAWGRNNYQQTDVPTAASNGVVAIAAGYYTSFALKSDGTVVGWGRGSYGATVPSDALSGVVAISAGRNHAMALKTNGIVKAWGSPPSDQVTTSTGAPVGLSGVTEISAGRYYSMALKSDRTLQAWGETDYAGDPFLTPSNLANVNFIQGARNHGLAIVSDGQAPRLDLPMAPIQLAPGGSTNLSLKGPVTSPTFSQLGMPAGVTLSSGGALTAASNAAVTNTFARIMVANADGSDSRVVNLQVLSGDINPPTITLSGNALILLESGDAYTDEGATVTDNVDASIVPRKELTGTGIVYPIPYDDSFGVTASPGVYTITYRAQDAAGNQATPVTRTVKVFPNGYLAWANSYGLFSTNVPDSFSDGDADGMDNLREFTAGTDPGKADTDGDGISDNTDTYPLTANHNFDIYLGLMELCRQDSASGPVPDYPVGVSSGAVFEKLLYATAPTGSGIAKVEVRKGGSVVAGGDLIVVSSAGLGRIEFAATNEVSPTVVDPADSQWERNLLTHGNYSFRGLSISNQETTNRTVKWNDGTGPDGAGVIPDYPGPAPRLTSTNWANGDLCLPSATHAVLAWSNNWTNHLDYGWIRLEVERRLASGSPEKYVEEIAVTGSNLPTQIDLGAKGFLTNNAHYTAKLIFSIWKDGAVRGKQTRFHFVTGPKSPPSAPAIASLVAANDANKVGPISSTDPDGDNPVQLSLPASSFDNSFFVLEGGDLKLRSGSFDRATKASYQVLVRATDASGMFAESFLTLSVPKRLQTISFGGLGPKTFGDSNFSAGATINSGLPISFASSNPGVAIVAGGYIQILGAGQTTITASQAGDSVYAAATPVSQTLTVSATGGAIASGGGVSLSSSSSASSVAPVLQLPATLVYGHKIVLPGALQAARVGENNLNLAVPDGNPAGLSRQLSLTGLSRSNYRLTVGLNLYAPEGGFGAALGDYYAYLRHSNEGITAQTRVLLNRVGVAADPLGVGSLADGINAIFADAVETNIQSAADPVSGPLTGTFQPTSLLSGSSNGLNSMGSTDWNGTWTLFVEDQQSGGTANLVDWFLQFEDLSAATASTGSDGLQYEVVDSPTVGDDGTDKASISGNELEAKSGTGRITIRAQYAGSSNNLWATSTITLQKATQSIAFTNRPVTVVSNRPYLFDPGASSSAGLPLAYASDNTNVAVSGTNGVQIVGAGVARLAVSAAGNENYGSASETNQILTVLASPSPMPFREDFTSPGLNPFTTYNYNWGLSDFALSLTSDFFLSNTNGRLTFSAPRSAAAGATPNLTLPITNSWTVEATVNVPDSSPYHSMGLNIVRDVYHGAQYYPSDQLVLQYYAYGGAKTVRSYWAAQSGASATLASQNSSAASLRLAMRYDHQNRQLTCLYRDATNAPWQTNGVHSLAMNGTIGTAWGLQENDVFRVGFFGETQNSTGTAEADLSLDEIYVQVQTVPELSLSGALTGKVDEALSGGYPVLFSGHPIIAFSASNLPVGLTIDGASGLITGTPRAGGQGIATIVASNSYGVVRTNLSYDITRASSAIRINDTNRFTYNGSSQGPAGVIPTGSGGAVSYTYEGTNGTTYAASSSRPTNVGEYTVVASLAGDGNYESATSLPFVFTIEKATPVMAEAPTASAINYGQTLAASALSGGTASTPGTFAFTAPATVPDAGTANQDVTFTPTDSANYTTARTIASVTVNPALASLTVGGLNPTYDGSAKSVTVTVVPSVAGFSVTYDGSTNPPTHAGSYTVVVTVANGNYRGVTTNTLSIAKATPTIIVGPATGAITYGQTLLESGLTGGTASTAGTFAFKTPATVPNAGAENWEVTFAPEDADNYNSATASVRVVVNPAALSITGLAGKNKSYDGTKTADVAGVATLSGRVGLDGPSEVALTGSLTFEFSDANVGTNKTITVSGGTLSGEKSGNYQLIYPTDLKADIAAAKLVAVSFIPPASLVYDRIAKSHTATATGPSSLILTYTGRNATTYSNVAAPVVVGDYTVTATTPDSNYSGSQSQDFSITAKELTISGAAATSRTYNGLTNVVVSGGSLKGLETGDTVNLVGSPAGSISSAAVGTNKPVAVTGYAINGSDAGNYTLAQPTGLTVDISKATPVISAAPTAGPINFGQTVGDSVLTGGTADVEGAFAFTQPSTTPTGTGTTVQGVTFTPTDTTNYANATTSVSVRVNRATPTISAAPTASTIMYGQTLAESLLSGGSGSVAGSFAFTSPSTAPNAGTASQGVTFTPTDTVNYDAATTYVNVTVSKAPQTIAFSLSESSVLSTVGTLPLNASASSGLGVTFETTDIQVATVSESTLTVVGPGTVTITAKQSGSSNYEAATPVTQVLTVVDADLPLAGADEETVAPIAGEPAKFPVARLLLNDRPSASPSDTRTLSITGVSTSSTQGGTVSRKGNWIVYIPNNNAVSAGSDSFTYTLSNGTKTTTGTVNLTLIMPDFTLRVAIESVVDRQAGGKTVTFAVSPNKTFEVQATSDLANWTTINATATSFSDGRLVVDDPVAGSARFYRVRWIP